MAAAGLNPNEALPIGDAPLPDPSAPEAQP